MEFTEILALLTAKFSGMRKDVLTNIAKAFAMAASSEDDAKKLVEGLTEDKVAAFSKDFRSGIDREVSNAKTAHEKSLRDKFDFTEKKSDPSDPGKTDPGKGDPNDVSTIVADAKAQFGYDAVHAVYDAVEKKLAGWAGMSLQDQKKKLSFEINWVSTNQKYPTWKVAMQAYQKKLDEVEYKIEKETLEQPDLISIPTVSNLPSFIVFAKYAFIFLNLLDQLFY